MLRISFLKSTPPPSHLSSSTLDIIGVDSRERGEQRKEREEIRIRILGDEGNLHFFLPSSNFANLESIYEEKKRERKFDLTLNDAVFDW